MPRRKREITPTLPIEPLDPSQSVEQAKDVRHQLWLIYSQLKDAESNAAQRLELLERSREDLGRVLNEINRQDEPFLASGSKKPKSPRSQAAILNCRDRQFNLTADNRGASLPLTVEAECLIPPSSGNTQTEGCFRCFSIFLASSLKKFANNTHISLLRQQLS